MKNKNILIIIIVSFLIIAAIIGIYVLYKLNESANKTGKENKIENIIENTVENTIKNETVNITDNTEDENNDSADEAANDITQTIKYDIKIEKNQNIDTGYATDLQFELINIEERKAYLIKDHYVWSPIADESEKGHHYEVTEKEITKERIDKIIETFNKNKNNELENINGLFWMVEYQNEVAYLSDFNFD